MPRRAFHRKAPVRMAVRGRECWISATKQFERKIHCPNKYVTSISGRTDAPEVRCGLLTDRQTERRTHRQPNYRNPCCACAPRLTNNRSGRTIILWCSICFKNPNRSIGPKNRSIGPNNRSIVH